MAVALLGCGDCADESGAFFDPETFGTYEFDPAPDIDAPRVLDYGEVEVAGYASRELPIANVGRLDLVIDGLELDSSAFSVDTLIFQDDQVIASRDERWVDVDFRALSPDPVRATLTILSNDPDEAEFDVTLLANQTTPCVGSFAPGEPRWQLHDGEGPRCWPELTDGHGHQAAYQFANIPAADDAGWVPELDNHISFERRSTLCDTDCRCRGGGDFTYFQTFMFVPEGGRVGRYEVEIDNVDDGARVTVFNAAAPTGITDPDSYARIPGGSSADLAPYLVAGENRIVITHVDDCCSISRIRDVRVTIDGAEIESCD